MMGFWMNQQVGGWMGRWVHNEEESGGMGVVGGQRDEWAGGWMMDGWMCRRVQRKYIS